MDIAIQSQIQSPLVRTLQSIPTNSSNYVHGIPDNTPPFSKNKVKISPDRGEIMENNLDSEFTFKIPQGGHLSKMWLLYRMRGHSSTLNKTAFQDLDNPFNFSQSIEWVELRTHNSRIERLYPSSIVFQNASLVSSGTATRNLLHGLAGYYGIDTTRVVYAEPRLTDPLKENTPNEGSQVQLSHTDYAIPLPFSFCSYLKDNLQTRMMEDLKIVVKMKRHPSQHLLLDIKTAGEPVEKDQHVMNLNVEFINFHENVEEVIRNENFKPNIPAALLTNDYDSYEARFVSRKNLTAAFSQYMYSVDLNSDALVSNIFVHASASTPSKLYKRVLDMNQYALHFKLISGNEVILEGSKFEFDSVDSLNYSTVTRQYQSEGVLPPRWSQSGTNIRLALNNTDEYFDGGISFQSLTNPRLEIFVHAPSGNTRPFKITNSIGAEVNYYFNTEPDLVTFDVVLKRKVMLRIDGNTGKIQKSLES